MLTSLKKKDGNYFRIPFFIEQDEDKVWVAESPIFDGCITQGYDLKELKDNIEDVSNLYFGLVKDGEQVLKGKYLISVNFDKNGKITNIF